jgi:hypothetical protein
LSTTNDPSSVPTTCAILYNDMSVANNNASIVVNTRKLDKSRVPWPTFLYVKCLQLAGYAYVDDTDIIAHSKHGEDDAVALMQRSLDL